MRLLPIEESLTPIAIAFVFAVLLPPLILRGLRLIVGEGASLRHAGLGAGVGVVAAVAVASHGAIGPSFADSPWTGVPLTGALSLLAATLLQRGLPPREDGERRAGAVAIGVLLGLFPLGLLFAAEALTDVQPAEPYTVSETSAWWRIRVDPWDADALLALAWAAERRDEGSGLAAERSARARELGALESEVATLDAALAAADENCELARSMYDRALAARAREALEAGESLELGHPLPEVLVRRCELTSPAGILDR
ncbi:MAG: hypothetical protein AAGE52_15655 [Myxococcota bacterium]